MKLLKSEPAVWIGLALTVLVAAADQLLHLTDGQWQRIVDLAPLASGALTRFRVSPADSRDTVQRVLDALAEAEHEAEAAQARLAQLRTAVDGTAPPAPVAPAA